MTPKKSKAKPKRSGKPQCKCIEQVNANLVDTNTALKTEVMFTLTGDSWEVLPVPTVKRDTKKREAAKTVMGSYCPFCGVKTA